MYSNKHIQALYELAKLAAHIKLHSSGPKAHAEEEASRNPEAFMKKMKNPNFTKLKGIAF